MGDTFYTVCGEGESKVTEKMSRFLGFARHVDSVEEAKAFVNEIRNRYHDARHVCWAYALGPTREVWQLNDNGEPSGTAGKPILGQISSYDVTDTVVAVVRYFGGIKLGTSGLTIAYREAAREALEAAGRKECHIMRSAEITFGYIGMNDVMKVLKSEEVEIGGQEFGNTCVFRISAREDFWERIAGRLLGVEGLSLVEVDG